VSVAASAEELRSQHELRALLPEENMLPVSRLPSGVYGFTVPWAITDVNALSKEEGGTVVLEIHKLDSGLRAVGFLSRDDVVDLRDPSRTHALELTLSMFPTPTRPCAVSIPLSTVQYLRHRETEGIDVIDMMVKHNQ
jgi:hypothetical protein